MGSIYNQLTAGERKTLMVMRSEGASQSFVAEYLGRDRSTICRVSTPERSCIGSPERICINDSTKKAPELGAFS